MRWRKGRGDDDPEQPSSSSEDVIADRPDVPVDLGRVEGDQLRQAARRAVARALTEDLAARSDLTSSLTIPVGTRGRALLVAREPGVVAGLELIKEVCAQVDHRIEVKLTHFDGDAVRRGTVVAELEGPLRTLLTAERTLLNLVCHLSGIATRTRQFAEALEGTDCVVRDTRKTTPGLRVLEKHAVHVGGGANHRMGLYDAVLVKDNHVAAAGGVTAAAKAALDGVPEGVHVQVEVTSLEEAEEAIAAGVVDLLLDNFTPEELAEAVRAIAGRAAVEASGGITLETARAYAEAGADRLAVGALTHSAPSLDLALDVVEVVPSEHASRLEQAALRGASTPGTGAAGPGDVSGEGDLTPGAEDPVDDAVNGQDGQHDVVSDDEQPRDEQPDDEQSEDGQPDAEQPDAEQPDDGLAAALFDRDDSED